RRGQELEFDIHTKARVVGPVHRSDRTWADCAEDRKMSPSAGCSARRLVEWREEVASSLVDTPKRRDEFLEVVRRSGVFARFFRRSVGGIRRIDRFPPRDCLRKG